MINVTELRIGNLLAFDGTLHACSQADLMDIFSFNHSYNEAAEPFDIEPWHRVFEKIQPIPLTADILERCGFVDGILTVFTTNAGESYFKAAGNSPSVCYASRRDPSVSLGAGTTVSRYVDHLHQLQNLYFALTGKELTYTP